MNTPQVPREKMTCPYCKGEYTVNKDGFIRRHLMMANGRKVPCDGDGDVVRERYR